MFILERVVPLITEAVVEATAAGGSERRGFLARELVPLLASATNILHRPEFKRKFYTLSKKSVLLTND